MADKPAAPAPGARIRVGVDVSYFKTDGGLHASGFFQRAFLTPDGRTVNGRHVVAHVRGLRDNGGPGSLPGLGGEKSAGWDGPILVMCAAAVPSLVLISGGAVRAEPAALADLEELEVLRLAARERRGCGPRAETAFLYQMETPAPQKDLPPPEPGTLDGFPVYTYPTGYKFSLCHNHYHRPAEVLWADGAYALVEMVKYGSARSLRLYRGPKDCYRTISRRDAPLWLIDKVNDVGVMI